MDYKVTKIDAAVDQIDWAIKLFLDSRAYIPAITLAGAAEEVIGQTLTGQDVFNQLKKAFSSELDMPEAIVSQCYLNKTRNWLKHWGDLQDEEAITADFEAEAVQYIVRAIVNLVLHDHSLPSEGLRFFEWLTAHQQRLGVVTPDLSF
jgi:hypothetical protein